MNTKKFIPVLSIVTLLSIVGTTGCATISPAVTPLKPIETVYIVQRGDTLAEIAQKMTGSEDNWSSIAQYNGISNPKRLKEGQRLVIPNNQSVGSSQLSSAGSSAPTGTYASTPGTTTTADTYASTAPTTDPSGPVNTPPDPLPNPHLAAIQGAIGGAILGGLTAALLGDRDNRGRNIAIGALSGAALGGLVGSEIDKRRGRYARAEDFYDDQIRQTAQLNRDLANTNRNLRYSIQADQRQIDFLVAQYRAGKTTQARLIAAKQAIDQKYAANNQKMEAARKELALQQDVLAQLQRSGQTQRAIVLQQEIQQVKSNLNTLQQQVGQLASMSSPLGAYM